MDIIDGNDLTDIHGLPAGAEVGYLARRASSAVGAVWCNPTTEVPQWVKDIAIDVALRGAANPAGRTSHTSTTSVDDASHSQTERFEGRALGFELSDAERARLCPRARRGIGSMRLRVPGYQP